MKLKKKIKIGTYQNKSNRKKHYYLRLKDLENNVLMSGNPNFGKKKVLQNLLLEQPDIPFLLITINKDFKLIKEKLDNVLILKPGIIFAINIFDSYGLNPYIYAQTIVECLSYYKNSKSDISPFSKYILGRILENIYKNQDLKDFDSFNDICAGIFDQNDKTILKENEIEDLRKDNPLFLKRTIDLIRNSMKCSFKGKLKKIYTKKSSFDVEELFSRNIILDLNSIFNFGGNIEDIIIFLCILFIHIEDYKIRRKFTINEKNINHFTILDNAQIYKHNIIGNEIIKYWEIIAFYLRRRGECLVTISDDPLVSEDALFNNGVIISFKHSVDYLVLSEALNLKKENKELIKSLDYGEFLLKTNSIPYPLLLNV